jgi:hypothetical protein
MFTKQQLDLLIDAQSGDDWTANYFVYHRVPEVRQESDISQEDFEGLVEFLEKLNYEQVKDLQLALMILDNLPG